jgi:hypothetical protein
VGSSRKSAASMTGKSLVDPPKKAETEFVVDAVWDVSRMTQNSESELVSSSSSLYSSVESLSAPRSLRSISDARPSSVSSPPYLYCPSAIAPESRLKGVNRRNMKIINFKHELYLGLGLEMSNNEIGVPKRILLAIVDDFGS